MVARTLLSLLYGSGIIFEKHALVSLGTQTTVVAKVISELKLFSKNGPLDTHR